MVYLLTSFQELFTLLQASRRDAPSNNTSTKMLPYECLAIIIVVRSVQAIVPDD